MAGKKTSKLRITLKRSVIGEKPRTRATVDGLGLKRINQTVEHEDSPSIQGMIHMVRHLVEVDEG